MARFYDGGEDRILVGDEAIYHISGGEITSGNHKAAGLVHNHGVDLGLAVTDPLVLHQDRQPRLAASWIQSVSATRSSAGIP